jgi:hypothetical protein
MVRGMRRYRFHANSMAIYAMFLVTVGVPLLALTVDITRYMVAVVELRTATMAGCQAYANSLDIAKFQATGNVEFKSGAYGKASEIFHLAMPASASFFANELKGSDAGPKEKVVRCTGRTSIQPLIPLLENYSASAVIVTKTKFSTQKGGN